MDKDVKEIIEKKLIAERKNYTYRLPIYLAEMFYKVCEDKGITTVDQLEKWLLEFVEPHRKEMHAKVIKKTVTITDKKKKQEKKYRNK